MAKSLIPGFDPNRSNNYVRQPDAPSNAAAPVTAPAPAAPPAAAADLPGSPRNPSAPMLAPSAPQQTPANGATAPAAPGDFWSLTGPGWGGPSSQQVSDWVTVAGSNQPYAAAYKRATGQQTPADLVKLQADVEAARQRLGPWGAGSADFVGSTANPTNLLTRIPVVGPGFAGATQSAFKDYGAGKDWSTIGKDAAVGFGIGEGSLGLVQPAVAKNILARLTDVGGSTLAGSLLGHSWGGEFSVPGMIGAKDFLKSTAERVGGFAESALDNPTTRQALQQLLYGGALTAKPDAMPPLPGF
jgi:hypothetical protein